MKVVVMVLPGLAGVVAVLLVERGAATASMTLQETPDTSTAVAMGMGVVLSRGGPPGLNQHSPTLRMVVGLSGKSAAVNR